MQWIYREKRNNQEHHEKVSFFHLAKFWMVLFLLFLRKCPLQFPCFISEKISFSIPLLLVILLAHVGKRSSSHSQTFSKTVVFQYFAIFIGRNLFLIKFQGWRPAYLFKKRLQRRCLFVNFAKCLRTAFV